jgi:hypothetical protein
MAAEQRHFNVKGDIIRMQSIPVGILLIGTIIILLIADQAGYSLGHAAMQRAVNEKESSVSTRASAILALVAFILAFTFGIVSNRYDSRKELVRNEATAIRTSYMRADFLPEPERSESIRLLKEYLDLRIASVQSNDLSRVQKGLTESAMIQQKLWDMAVINARRDMSSDIYALYIESLNEMININSLRVAVGLQMRIPTGIWLSLYAIIILGMIGIGYQGAISGSPRRSWATFIVVIAFSMVIGLVSSLDRPNSAFIRVSQQPLSDLSSSMNTGSEAKQVE